MSGDVSKVRQGKDGKLKYRKAYPSFRNEAVARRVGPEPCWIMNYFDADHGRHVFVFSFPGPGPVFLVGDFNRWKAAPGYAMRRQNHRWEIELMLPAGLYRYGFEVRGCLFEDPESMHLRRSLGWPRSCAVCPARSFCKMSEQKSKSTTVSARGNE